MDNYARMAEMISVFQKKLFIRLGLVAIADAFNMYNWVNMNNLNLNIIYLSIELYYNLQSIALSYRCCNILCFSLFKRAIESQVCYSYHLHCGIGFCNSWRINMLVVVESCRYKATILHFLFR
jgi:hypothetical protein